MVTADILVFSWPNLSHSDSVHYTLVLTIVILIIFSTTMKNLFFYLGVIYNQDKATHTALVIIRLSLLYNFYSGTEPNSWFYILLDIKSIHSFQCLGRMKKVKYHFLCFKLCYCPFERSWHNSRL